jgi:predicted dehydrogenase
LREDAPQERLIKEFLKMTNRIIRAGVIGYGMAGRIFHTAVLSSVEGMELGGIVQRKGDEAARAYPAVPIYRSVEAMLEDKSLELVVVATPNVSHMPLAKQLLEAGRNVVVDKPFALSTTDAAEAIVLAHKQGLVLSAYQNRRWDGDFLTVKKLIASGELGNLVSFESCYDRWRPQPRLDVWRENGGPGGGTLLDLGSHLVDQALNLFGLPTHLTAQVLTERAAARVDDAFEIRLQYPTHSVLLRGRCLAAIQRPRFLLHGTRGAFMKWGLDPQEEALKQGAKFTDAGFGLEPAAAWGTLTVDAEGTLVTRPVQTVAGDYRCYYANVRDAILGVAPLAVPGEDAWRSLRILELARESSQRGMTLPCDWSTAP